MPTYGVPPGLVTPPRHSPDVEERNAALHAPEPRVERVDDRGDALRPETGEQRESSVVGRLLQILQRADPEIVVEAIGGGAADAGNRSKEFLRVRRAAQPREHRETPRLHHVPDRTRETLPDPRERFEAGEPLRRVDVVHGAVERT